MEWRVSAVEVPPLVPAPWPVVRPAVQARLPVVSDTWSSNDARISDIPRTGSAARAFRAEDLANPSDRRTADSGP